jgi:hypothetical protein
VTQPPLPSALPTELSLEGAAIGSPFKKQRSSLSALPGSDSELGKVLGISASIGGPRRESEGGVTTGFASKGGTSWPTTLPESSVAQFQAGPVVKAEPTVEAEMEEEL